MLPLLMLSCQKQIKVGMITHGFNGGGVEIVIERMAQYLMDDYDMKIYIIYSHVNVPIPILKDPRVVLVKWRDYIDFYSIQRKHNIDLYIHHEYWNPKHYELANAIKKSGSKYIYYFNLNFNMYSYEHSLTNYYQMHKKTVIELADAMIALNVYCAMQWNKVGVKNVYMIGNMLTLPLPNEDQLQKLVRPLHLILSVGRLNRHQKQQHLALQALKLIVKEVPDAKLMFVGSTKGESQYKQELDLYIQQNNLFNNVEFREYSNEIESFYKNASVFLLTSAFEATPLVLQEAKAYKLPSVMFALRYADAGRKGVIQVQKGDVAQMAKEVVELLQNQSKRESLGQEAYESVKSVLPAVQMPKWKVVIDNVLAGKKVGMELFDQAPLSKQEVKDIVADEKQFLKKDFIDQK